VQERDRATLKDLADVSSRLPDKTLQLNPSEVSVSTQFFLLNGQVQYRDVTVWRTTLVARDAITTRLVWERPW
jgi:type II secretory pathway component PulK